MFPLLPSLLNTAMIVGSKKAALSSLALAASSSRSDDNDSIKHRPVIEQNQTIIEKTKAVSRGKFCDLCKGLAKSKIVRALAFAAIAVGVLFLIVSNPVGWLIAVVAIGAFTVSLLAQLPVWKGKQMLAFEATAFKRLIKGKNYNHIKFTTRLQTTPNFKLFLGALPNRLGNDGERLAKKEKVGAVLSVNESWERNPLGLSLPHTSVDWENLHVQYKEFDVLDHTFLSPDKLNQAADWINAQRLKNHNVYVHCRAGVGRSAMAVAAYLIKYEGMTFKDAKDVILTYRPKSTIAKKAEGLIDFAGKVKDRTYPLDPVV